MNHIYRVIWNSSAACWQAVSETARGRSKSSSKLLKPLLVAASVAASGVAMAAPTGGSVASGTASIGVSGSTTTINQSTAKAVINWNDFSIANGETVNFVQPDANAIALNRVTSSTASSIQGALNANGQVFIVNPNGITFGSTAQVNVGGLVASTLDISDTDFNNGTYRFANTSNNASISNQGAITVANTGTAALIAPSIQQAGSIVNNDGSILLTAASDVTLSLTNRVLNSQTINAGHNTATINNSAGSIQADGGKVILTAQGINASSTASISSAGIIRSQTLAGNDRGAIDLIADSASGVVNLTGTLDASAPTSGNAGGTIRTIGADVAVANTASVSTRKVNQTSLPGTSSYWQIKANSITVGSGGTISGSKLSSSLNDGSVTLTASGTGAGQGSININDAVSTSSNVILNLAATKDINFNNNVGLTANLGRLVMSYGTGNDYNLNNNSKITLSGAGATLRINSTDYTVINSLGVAGDTTSTTLQGIKNNLTGNYALGSDIDASSTSGWNSGKGFDPIGSYSKTLYMHEDSSNPGYILQSETETYTPYTGQFHGLGHTVSNLHINRTEAFPATIPPVSSLPLTFTESSVGLFGLTQNRIRDIGLTNVDVTGHHYVGGLIGIQYSGNVTQTFSEGVVAGTEDVGGLVGLNYAGDVKDSHSSGNVSGNSSKTVTSVGGLIGRTGPTMTSTESNTVNGVPVTSGQVINSYSSANVQGYIAVGGLIGYSVNPVYSSHASGNVSLIATQPQGAFFGGLIGGAGGGIYNSYATGDVSGAIHGAGGLVGMGGYASDSQFISNSYATGNVTGVTVLGGLVGGLANANTGQHTVVKSSYATGSVTGSGMGVGGLIGVMDLNNKVQNSYAAGPVSGDDKVGGLVGRNAGAVENSYAKSLVSGNTDVGGLIGKAESGSSVNSSYWDTIISGQSSSAGGTGKTTAELKQIATFTGWDIANVSNTTSNSTWVIDENNSTPWLR